MARLQAYADPFGDVFEDLFKGFLVRPLSGDAPQIAQKLRVEVSDEGQSYKVLAEIPGVKKEDIQVTIDGDQVSISAEVKQEKESSENAGRVLHSERYYGKLSRSFRLGQDVDRDAAQAKYNDGVLELNLPKKAAENARQITIQ
jgi:HSP20 family protein